MVTIGHLRHLANACERQIRNATWPFAGDERRAGFATMKITSLNSLSQTLLPCSIGKGQPKLRRLTNRFINHLFPNLKRVLR